MTTPKSPNKASYSSSDLTFIMNEGDNNLSQRFEALLKSTKSFDCLVGYFYLSGFHKIHHSLVGTEKIRILIGIETDRSTFNLIEKGNSENNIQNLSHAEARACVPGSIVKELESSDDSSDVESGVMKFIEWIKSGKLEVRAWPHDSRKIHAKVYVMTFNDGDRDTGRVITGSSNLTQSGLVQNLEFNVELKNKSDHHFALDKFNELWKDSVDVTSDYVATIENKSPFAHFSPVELYLKLLYEYFRAELNYSGANEIYLPEGYKRLKYQADAVLNLKRIIDEYGGAFLSDVVGLGKTYMSAMLALQINEPCLVIAPPHLLDEKNPGSWVRVFRKFGVRGYKTESLGKLESLIKSTSDLDSYTTVFIDESHRFRTQDTINYDLLSRICKGKRVVLVSATPLNNSPHDILSQLKLFQASRNSTIPNLKNLESFFSNLTTKLKKLDKKRDYDAYVRIVKENSHLIRERILKYLMVRRTRGEIVKYYGEDLKAQGMMFPTVSDPVPLFYKFNENEADVFNQTINLLTKEFKYSRYTALLYYQGAREAGQSELQTHKNLAKFMKILTIKRLESSFPAFKRTIENYISAYEKFIDQFTKGGRVFISKKHISRIFDLLDNDDYDSVQKLIDDDRAEELPAKEFKETFLVDLKDDLKALLKIRELWKTLTRDPKWESFKEILKNEKRLKESKLIIFTESMETANYLYHKIKTELDPKVFVFTGASSEPDRETVIINFDDKVSDSERKDDYRIIIATDVLAEGVNLHRSNVVINYDIPWNPTRMIQRVGRINRVDTKFKEIFTYNFFPTDEGDNEIKLRANAESKIHAFIQMLGADSRLLSDTEEPSSHDIFSKLNSKETITGEDPNEESELAYLTEIRNIREKNPDLFDRIKRLPRKARSSKLSTVVSDISLPSLLTYFRKGKLDKFYIGKSSGIIEEIDFLQTAKLLKPKDYSEPRITIPHNVYYKLIKSNIEAFESSMREDEDQSSVGVGRGNTSDAFILKRLRANDIKNCKTYTDEDDEFIQNVIKIFEEGLVPKLTAKKLAESIKDRSNIEPMKVLGVLKKYIKDDLFLRNPAAARSTGSTVRESILSSYIYKSE